jgi:hypothetical protein
VTPTRRWAVCVEEGAAPRWRRPSSGIARETLNRSMQRTSLSGELRRILTALPSVGTSGRLKHQGLTKGFDRRSSSNRREDGSEEP